MVTFLMNNWGSILVGTILAALIIGVMIKLRRDKKRGKSSCGCGCENCPSHSMCHKK